MFDNAKPQREIKHKLVHFHTYKHSFSGACGTFYILGDIPLNLSNLRVTLMLVTNEENVRYRTKLDLYENLEIEKFCYEVIEKEFQFKFITLQKDLHTLTDLLEKYREELYNDAFKIEFERPKNHLTNKTKKQVIDFLKAPNLIKAMDTKLEETGIVGEENARVLLYLIALSYKSPFPLHALIQSGTGSGKSHLLKKIMACLPKADVMSITRTTGKSFYHYANDDLVGKCIIIQDMDGFNDDALFSFRELQSEGFITTSTTYKDKLGNIKSRIKTVNAYFSSIASTTRTSVYSDNFNRSIPIHLDESIEQTQRIVHYQNSVIAGNVDAVKEEQAIDFLVNCTMQLEKLQVLNRFAEKIVLPAHVPFLRRSNLQLQKLILLVTYLHQYQRDRSPCGKILSTKDDVTIAFNLFVHALYLKTDELDGQTRRFFEELKPYLYERGQKTFRLREIRLHFSMSKTQLHRYISTLIEHELVLVKNGTAYKGYVYEIQNHDDIKHSNATLKKHLNAILEEL